MMSTLMGVLPIQCFWTGSIKNGPCFVKIGSRKYISCWEIRLIVGIIELGIFVDGKSGQRTASVM